MALAKRMLDFRLGRFAVVGMANTCLGLSVIFACKAILGLGDVESNALGYGLAIVAGFVMNKHWTFEHQGQPAKAFARYLLVLMLAYAANLTTTLYAIDILHLNSYLAQTAGIVPYAVTGYVGGRLFAFAPPRR